MERKERNQLIKTSHPIQDHQSMEAALMMTLNPSNLKTKTNTTPMNSYGPPTRIKGLNHLLDPQEVDQLHEILYDLINLIY